jgi:hypothetical protein
VEGTYNGNLRHTLYPKIHFTGSINPGMSGGPTITERGQVVGVNVSTMGEQRSFLVPERQAEALVARAGDPTYEPPAEFLPEIARQLAEYQDVYLDGLLSGEPKMVDIGRFRVVTEPSPIFRCWGSGDRDPEELYEELQHSCSTDDDVFIAGDHTSGVIDVSHRVLIANGLNATRFAALYTRYFSYDHTPGGDEKHVTKWTCETRNVRTDGATMRAVLCLRRLRKLEGLYDATLKVAVPGAREGSKEVCELVGQSHPSKD